MELTTLEIGTRASLRVKCIEVLVQSISANAHISELLVADESACALLLASQSYEAMSPGSTVDLHDVCVTSENGRLVLRLDAFSSVAGVPEEERMLLINLQKNVSWTKRELIKL